MAATVGAKAPLCHHASLVSPSASRPLDRLAGARPIGRKTTCSFLGGGSVSRGPASRVVRHRASRLKVSANTVEEMNAAEKRWNEQVRQGRVRSVSGKEASQMFKDGVALLDVRPVEEVEKVAVIGATNVPLFMVDDDTSIGGLLKQMSAFGMGGWWLGGQHMRPNSKFLPTVLASLPNKDEPIVVACQKGLRSLASCEQLSRAGYTNISWLNGGFDAVEKGDGFATTDDKDLRYAGIGGVSAILGWTPVQQQEATVKGPFGSVDGLLKGMAGVVLLDALLFGYQVLTNPDGPSSIFFQMGP